MEASNQQFAVSVVVSTYNRCEQLHKALASIVTQTTNSRVYEVIVVDNNSTDRTREVVQSFADRNEILVRYVFEERQGVSYARNAGIAHAQAPLIAFFDDDCRVSENWIETIQRLFEAHPEVDCAGGRVLPCWEVPPPRWLTREHWAPIALQDYGDHSFYVTQDRQVCLLSANLVFRRRAFELCGVFAPELQRVNNSLGSMEDLELLMRFWRTGGRALYSPQLVVHATVPAGRMTRAYHHQWHRGHGAFYAMLRNEGFEHSNRGRMLGVPAHLYRQAAIDAALWITNTAIGRRDLAFACTTRFCFFLGFFNKRREQRKRDREKFASARSRREKRRIEPPASERFGTTVD